MKKHIFKTIPGLTPTSIALLILVQTLPATQGFERKTGAARCSQSTKAVLIKSYLNADKLCI